MMYKFAIFITFAIIAVVWGATISEPTEEGEVGYCTYRGLQIKKGETVPAPIGQCRKVTCKNPEHNAITSLTCPMWQLAPGSNCHKSEIDLTKEWPACCPKKVCPEE